MKRSLITGIIIISIISIVTIVGVFWTPYSVTEMNYEIKNQAPSLAHIFGTDNYGRDVFSRIMKGLGNTMFISVCTVAIGGTIGTLIGMFTGYWGGMADKIIMSFNDILLSFPKVLLALLFVTVFGPGKYNVILALGILFIPSFARMMRGDTIKLKEEGYVESAKALGIPDIKIMFRHILPNAKNNLLVSLTIGFNSAVLSEAGMSYLGLGVQPPQASLGRMLSESQGYLMTAPWCSISIGIVTILLVLGFSLIGEGLNKTI
ncbi:MAG: ABC transporter permease [Eubacterium sp.]